DVKRWQVRTVKVQTPGGRQEMLCLPLRKLPAWLTSISPSKVKPEIREKLSRYQEECDNVLWEYWNRTRKNTPPVRVDEEEEEDLHELFRKAERIERELETIRKLEEEGLDEDEARLELCRRAILGGRAVAALRDLRLGQPEISALFLARMAEKTVEDAARIAGVTKTEAEEAYRAFSLLGRDPWEVLNAAEAFKIPLPWEEGPAYGRLAECVEKAIARLCARAGSPSLLPRIAPPWLIFGEKWVYVTTEVFGEFGYGRPGDIWVLAEKLGWKKISRGKQKRERMAGLETAEFNARYFERKTGPSGLPSLPEPVARMAEWLARYWNCADGKHRAWLER
ncbi:TPA: hypothetical protein EYP13_01985, partial [Candidatus Micrarchaeota archaeon]|nr:hypothetical protein [Candidatus Micrarchaeota archaeon]